MDNSIIASRTPEGEPNYCPLCGKSVILEPSQPLGDAPCPHCGHLLWFFRAAGETRVIAEPDSPDQQRELLVVLATKRRIDVLRRFWKTLEMSSSKSRYQPEIETLIERAVAHLKALTGKDY